jgi:Zn-dependent membrane protease YugP
VDIFFQHISDTAWIIAGVVICILAIISEEVAAVLISLAVHLFRIRGKYGPEGKDLARQMLDAAGENGVKIDTTFLDTSFRLSFNDIDYQPDKNVLELTEDKAGRADTASAGLVVLEVGRTLQYRQNSPYFSIFRLLTPWVNFAGFAWLPATIVATVAASLIPLFVGEKYGPLICLMLQLVVLALFAIMAAFVLLKIPMETDAVRRGIKVMKETGIFSAGEARSIRIFLGLILAVTALTTALVALNFFRQTIATHSPASKS